MNSNLQGGTIAAAIIAGGKSRRFGDSHKAQAELGNCSLIEHVYRRLKTQAPKIWLNAPDHLKTPLDSILDRVADINTEHSGPLLGVLTTLQLAVEKNVEWLLIAPCDTPFIPENLAERLRTHCLEQSCLLGIPSYMGRNHPSLSLWHKSLLPDLTAAVLTDKKSGFKQFYPDFTDRFLIWDCQDHQETKDEQDNYDPFFNINYAEDLSQAADIIANNPHLQV